MAARQPSNELVADILSRAADPEIRQAGLRDAAKLLRAVIGIDVPLDDLSGAATIDESLRQTQRKSDEAGAKLRQLEREVAALETRKADLVAAIATIEPGSEVGKAKIERLTARTIELEAKLAEADKAEQRLTTARAGLSEVEARMAAIKQSFAT